MGKRVSKAVDLAFELHKRYGMPLDKAAEVALISLLEKKQKKRAKLVKHVEHNLSLLRLGESFKAMQSASNKALVL